MNLIVKTNQMKALEKRSLKLLQEERAEILAAVQEIEEKGEKTALEKRALVSLERDLDNLSEKIEQVEAEQRRNAKRAERNGSTILSNPEEKQVNPARAIGSEVYRLMLQDQGINTRDLDETNVTSVLQDPDVQTQVIQKLISAFPYTDLGAQFIGGGSLSSSNARNFARFPKVTGLPGMNWLASEGTTLSDDSSYTYSNVDLDHNTIASDVVKASFELMGDSEINLEEQIGNDLIRAFANEIARRVIDGSTANNQPDGILNTSGILTKSLSGTDLPTVGNFNDLVDAIEAVMNKDVPLERIGMVSSPEFRAQLNKTLATDNQPLMMPEMVDGIQKRYTTGVVNTFGAGSNETRAVFGDWSNLRISLRGPINIKLEERYADSLQFGFILYARITWAFMRADNFCALTGTQELTTT